MFHMINKNLLQKLKKKKTLSNLQNIWITILPLQPIKRPILVKSTSDSIVVSRLSDFVRISGTLTVNNKLFRYVPFLNDREFYKFRFIKPHNSLNSTLTIQTIDAKSSYNIKIPCRKFNIQTQTIKNIISYGFNSFFESHYIN